MADFELERDTEGIPCECGGYMDRVEMEDAHYTDKEIEEYGCGREKMFGYECCLRCFVCRICKRRVVCGAPAPEMDW